MPPYSIYRCWLVFTSCFCLTAEVALNSLDVRGQENPGPIVALPKAESGSTDASPDSEVDAGADGLTWHDVTTWGVEGRMLPEQPREHWFDRLPLAAKQTVTKSVWSLSQNSSGMLVRFRTNARAIHVHYQLTKSTLALPHMPATGVSGVDLYARDDDGRWRWVQATKPTATEVKVKLVDGLRPAQDKSGREFAAYLPLYNGVKWIRIGVPEASQLEGLAPRGRPLVFYGTSITQGACASRPGMVHTALLGRWLERPVVNLGFSGNGKMHAAVGDFMAQIDAAAYIIDCLPNMSPDLVRQRCVPLVQQLRSAQPETPIVLVEDRRFTNAWILPAKQDFHDRNHAALRHAWEKLLSEDPKNLFYIDGDTLYGNDSEGATDASHANDLGFMRQAESFLPILRQALAAESPTSGDNGS